MKVYIVLAITLTLAALAKAGYIEHPQLHGEELDGGYDAEDNELESKHYIDYHTHPKYHYDYAVHDLKHHDMKYQWETRDGDKVKGEYSLVEPDGTRRIVSYEADKNNGFNAVVKHEGHPIYQQAHY